MRTPVVIGLLASLLAAIGISAAEQSPAASSKADVHRLIDDLISESVWITFYRDAGGHQNVAVRNRVLSGYTVPRATSYPGVCASDDFTITALPERERGAEAAPYDSRSARIRGIEAETRYFLLAAQLRAGAPPMDEQDRACADLWRTLEGHPWSQFFDATDPGSVWMAGQITTRLAVEAAGPKSGWRLLRDCRRGKECPDAEAMKSLFQLRNIRHVREDRTCSSEHFCHRVSLYDIGPEQNWEVVVRYRRGTFGDDIHFEPVRFEKQAILGHM